MLCTRPAPKSTQCYQPQERVDRKGPEYQMESPGGLMTGGQWNAPPCRMPHGPQSPRLPLLLHRVDLVAKYLGGLREQEKQIKCLESQVSWQAVLPCGIVTEGSWGHSR